MDRSSSHKSLRAERLAASPYRRPPPTELKKSSSTTFATVRNMFSYALSPLFRSTSNELALPTTTSDLPVEIDQKSESGSEDNWTGSAPVLMQDQDVFDLAAAGGRDGEDFEQRAAEWRAKGEVPGGRRETARRGLEGAIAASTSSRQAQPLYLTNGQSNAIASSSTGQKRPLSPPTHATPLPTRSFLPPAATPAPPITTSASSVALTAFLDAKKGQPLTPEDFAVIESLTNNMKAEVGGSPSSSRQDVRYGGWSAGLSPRPTKSLPNFGDNSYNSTPARPTTTTPFGTPASTFSLGIGTPLSNSPNPNTYRQRYLGPGMSPRRMLNTSRSSPGLKPLLQFNSPSDEAEPKKRRIDGNDSVEVDSKSPSFTPSYTSPIDSPLKSEKGKGRAGLDFGSRPHPLSQSITASSPDTSKKQDPIALGKKRAADIMLALLEEQMVPETPSKDGSTSASSEQTHFEIINPYHKASIPSPQSSVHSPASTPSTPATRRTFESPRKPVLRSAMKDTPKRGAAARLEASKAERKLTTVEKLTGVKPWDAPAATPSKKQEKHVRVETPTRENDQMEVDDEIELGEPASASRSPEPAPAPAKVTGNETSRISIPEPEPFKPFDVPTLDSPARSVPSFQTKSSASTYESFESPSQQSALAASQAKTPAPKFQLTPAAATTSTPDDDESSYIRPEVSTPSTFNPTKIYFTAKDQALKVIKEALPFYTFTLPVVAAPDGVDTKKAKEAALKAPLKTFSFTLDETRPAAAESSASTLKPITAPAPAAAAEWTCDLCMLKNPASATEKCSICEAPKPAPKLATTAPAPPVSSAIPPPSSLPITPFQWPGKAPASTAAAGEWTCSVCMLKNPASATEKCQVCESPR